MLMHLAVVRDLFNLHAWKYVFFSFIFYSASFRDAVARKRCKGLSTPSQMSCENHTSAHFNSQLMLILYI